MDITALPHVSIHRRVDLPNISAIYFVLDEDCRPLYIGQSHLMRNRWEAHVKKAAAIEMGGWRIAWTAVPEDQLSTVERQMIELFDPPLNVRCRPRKPPER